MLADVIIVLLLLREYQFHFVLECKARGKEGMGSYRKIDFSSTEGRAFKEQELFCMGWTAFLVTRKVQKEGN